MGVLKFSTLFFWGVGGGGWVGGWVGDRVFSTEGMEGVPLPLAKTY